LEYGDIKGVLSSVYWREMLKSAIEEGRNVKEEVEIFSVQNGQT